MTNQLGEGFKRSVYWNIYKTKPAKIIEKEQNLYELLHTSFQGVRRLPIIAYVDAADAVNDEAGIENNNFFFQEERLIIVTY